jgi:hypothetical protein
MSASGEADVDDDHGSAMQAELAAGATARTRPTTLASTQGHAELGSTRGAERRRVGKGRRSRWHAVSRTAELAGGADAGVKSSKLGSACGEHILS